MKILIYGINFSPELTGIGKYSAEMVSWLSNNGHDVRVITAYPYYPHWKIQEGCKYWRWSIDAYGKTKVYRCPLWVPKRITGISRLIHLTTFALSSIPVLLIQLFWRPKFIVAIAPPLFITPATIIFKTFSRCKAVLHIQDFEIDAAFKIGLLRGGGLKKFAFMVECCLLKGFDLVSSISWQMLKKAELKKVSKEKLFLLPNWVDISSYFSLDAKKASKEYRDLLDLPQGATIALYSGNMGKKQGLDVLVEVARMAEFSNDKEGQLIFVFCGDGVEREVLFNQCKALSNVRFLDLQPEKTLPQFLCMADVHLLPQLSGAADLVMPSKLTGMFASGRSVIACADAWTELANVVTGRGIVVAPEDPVRLYEGLMYLVKNPTIREQYGISGREYALNNLDRDKILKDFDLKLQSLS